MELLTGCESLDVLFEFTKLFQACKSHALLFSPPSKANSCKEPRGGIFKEIKYLIILDLWKQLTAPGFLRLYFFNRKNKEVFQMRGSQNWTCSTFTTLLVSTGKD